MNSSIQNPFSDLGLLPAIVRATSDESYLEPTPVQREVIPAALTGRDVLACAQTGTGKTAAFVLPILQQLASLPRGNAIRVLILTPTRELAAQIAERIEAYGRHLNARHAVIYGGVSQFRQEQALRQKPELLVATPGRLLDLMGQGLVKLDQVAHFVLDEADRMLDMGFIHDVRRVLAALPKQRQTLFFSATVPRPIEQLAESMLKDPVRVSVTPKVTAAETIDQSVVFVAKDQKGELLEQLLRGAEIERAIVFTRTKHGADKLSRRLERAGIDAPAIHGNKSQNARERALMGFKQGKTRVLVATDIAARGIDVDGVSHVFNFDLPNVPESYVHRIGRTGRAGSLGRAISFCDREERPLLGDIERLLRHRLHVLEIARERASAASADAAPPVASDANGHGSSPRHPDAGSGDRFRQAQRPQSQHPHAGSGDRFRQPQRVQPQRSDAGPGDRFRQPERAQAQRSDAAPGDRFGQPPRVQSDRQPGRPWWHGQKRRRPLDGRSS